MPRKPTKAEVDAIIFSLVESSDSLLELTQIKAAVRLIKDDDYIDKSLRDYVDQVLSHKLNDLFYNAVRQAELPPKRFSVLEMLPTVEGKLFERLRTLTNNEIPVYIYSKAKTKLPFYDMIYIPSDEGYEIDCLINNSLHEVVSFHKDENEYEIMCPSDSMNVAYFTDKRPRYSIGLRCASCNFDPIRISRSKKILVRPEVLGEKED